MKTRLKNDRRQSWKIGMTIDKVLSEETIDISKTFKVNSQYF